MNTVGTMDAHGTISTVFGTIEVHGIVWKIVKASPYTFKGATRISYMVKRQRGKKLYNMVQYENGTFSTAV